MKSIKEKAKEAERNTHPLFESISESTGEPVSVYDQNDMLDMFEAGANCVFECLERAIELNESTFVYSREKYIKVEVLNKLIEQLKK